MSEELREVAKDADEILNVMIDEWNLNHPDEADEIITCLRDRFLDALASTPAKPAPVDGMREEEAPSIWPLGHGVVMTAAGEEDFAGHLFFAAVPDEMIGEPGQAGDKRDFQSLMSSNGPRMIIRFADEAAIDAHIALCEQARSALSSTTPEQR